MTTHNYSTTSSSSTSSSTNTLPDSNNNKEGNSIPTTTTPITNSFRKYKIAVVGAGAVGSYYGARLWEAGHDVQFYTRQPLPSSINDDPNDHDNQNDQADKDIRRDGLYVESAEAGNIFIPPFLCRSLFYQDTTNMQRADWILVTLKSHALPLIPDLIFPLLHTNGTSRIVAIMNGLVDQDLLQVLHQKEREREQEGQDDFKLQSNNNENNSHGNRSGNVETKEQDENDNLGLKTPPEEQQQQQQERQEQPGQQLSLSCCQTLYGGMAFIAATRRSRNHIHHQLGGRLAAGIVATQTTTSALAAAAEEEEAAFRNLFHSVKVPVSFDPNLLLGRWKKMLANLPFNGISVAMGGIAVQEIFQDHGLRQLALAVMDETIATANAELTFYYGPPAAGAAADADADHDNNSGHEKSQNHTNQNNNPWQPLTEADKWAMVQIGDKLGSFQTSTTLDFLHRRPMEVQYLFREPLNRARRLGVPVPHIQTIVTLIEAYQRKFNL
ncbi:hypothetical protein ACA910_010870 [Epithemia clementina (nom. ined.)]